MTTPADAVAVVTDGPVANRELGVGYEPDLMFDAFDDGAVWDVKTPTPSDFDEMLCRFGRAAGLELALTLPLRRAAHSIKPAKGDRGEAEWLTDALTAPPYSGGMSTPLRLVIAQLASACIYRRTYHEKVFKVRDGRWTYDKLAWRPPTTCKLRIDPVNGGFRGFQQDPIRPNDTNPDPIRIDAKYALVHINGKHRNPITGHSDLEVAYWCYETTKKLRFLWYQFLEAQVLPKTLVQHQDPAMAQHEAKRVATLRSAGVLGLSDAFKVNALDTSGKSDGDFYLQAIRFLQSEAAGSVLAGFLELTDSAAAGRGSFALSRDQSDFYLMSRTGAAVELAETFTSFGCADLILWNFGPRAAYPTFEFGPLSIEDAQVATTLLGTLAAAPELHIPFEFIEQLTLLVSTYLGIPVDKVAKAMVAQRELETRKAKTAVAARVAQVAAPVGAAARLVRQAQPGGAPNGRPAAATRAS